METAEVDNDTAFNLLGCDVANVGFGAIEVSGAVLEQMDARPRATWLAFMLELGDSVPFDDLSAWSID